MAEKYILINDIIDNHNQRMNNLKKYYPFFKLQEMTFAQYKDGRYDNLDMGYITLATLRFFIDENNFNERKVTYQNYYDFLKELLIRDFELNLNEEEMKELVLYIFDKIKNEGKPFYFHYFDPSDHKRKSFRIKFIESEIEEGIIYYLITSDAIEFYLDTKEMKDESQISVQQLLLEKMIGSKNFKGGIEVVRRINGEVSRMAYRRKEVIRTLEADVFEGAKAFEQYMNSVAKWFSKEEEMFQKNKELVETALARVSDENGQEESENYQLVLQDIYQLEKELKRTIQRHGELIQDTLQLQKVADHIIGTAKLRRLRPTFDFEKQLSNMKEQDDLQNLHILLEPFFKPNIKKTFSLFQIDKLLQNKPEHYVETEKVTVSKEEENFVFPDELEEQRIAANFKEFAVELLEQIKKKSKIDLKQLNGIFEIKFGEDIYHNGDYYSFLVHLCQKKEYQVKKMFEKQDTFFDGIVANELDRDEKERYEMMEFRLHFQQQEELLVAPGCYISNVEFERTDI